MDIKQPIIHDRHIVKQYFENMKSQNIHKNAFKIPKDLTIVTCRNEGSMEDRIIEHLKGYELKSILECSLEYLGIDELVVLKDDRLPWRNSFKVEMVNDYLNSGKCKTKYFMCCDAIDVIFKDDPQKVIDIFETFDCEALFMSTNSIDGYNCMTEVKEFVDNINGGSGRYMNTGVYIGKTDFIKEFIASALEYSLTPGTIMSEHHNFLKSNPIDFPKGSDDQCIFRFLEKRFYPRVNVDYENLMAYRG